jgi:hypothetical protein
MPHLVVTRPLREFYLSHELGNKPWFQLEHLLETLKQFLPVFVQAKVRRRDEERDPIGSDVVGIVLGE